MDYRVVFRLNGVIGICLSMALLFYGLGVFLEGKGDMLLGYNMLLMLMPLFISLCFFFVGKNGLDTLRARGAILLVALVWGCMVSIGAVPFLVEGATLVNAIFESASGFSTTGATIYTNFDNMSASLMMWRCFSEWIGGMGIIVFFVALLPALGKAGKMLFRSEVPGPIKDSLTPHMRDTTRLLWLVYVAFTLLLTGIYYFAGMSFYDAIAHSFTTIATGGFSTHEESMSYFSPGIQWIAVVFMLLSSINFSLYAGFLLRRRIAIFNDTELRWYFSFLIIACIVAVALLSVDSQFGVLELIRQGVFNVVSLTTTTGYTTVGYPIFSLPLQMLLLMCFFTGGSASSTTGGIKFFRVVLFFKMLSSEIKHSFSPSLVHSVRINHVSLPAEMLQRTIVFVAIYFTTIGFVGMIFYTTGQNFFLAFSAAASCVGNIGPVFSSTAENFVSFTPFAKLVAAFAMVVGRLEFFTIFTLFHASFWRKN